MKMQLPSIEDTGDLRGRRVVLRAALNVPVDNGIVQNDFRLRSALPTIMHLRQAGAKIVLIGHIGRDRHETLKPVYEALTRHVPVVWYGDTIDERVGETPIEDGEVLMLENVRQYEAEASNDAEFARLLASFGEIYINDAFPDSHRAHASIVGVPAHIPGYAGFAFMREYDELTKAQKPESPSLFIIGGSKFETKLPLIERYLNIYDSVLICGALANDVWRARGYQVGDSVVSNIDLSEAAFVHSPNIILPSDVTVKHGDLVSVKRPDAVGAGDIIYDAGPATMRELAERTAHAKTILWNGTLGFYEGGFAEYTKQCAEVIAQSEAFSIVGGGDTVTAIESLGLNADFGFVSAAGGAMLVFLETGTLPAIDALAALH